MLELSAWLQRLDGHRVFSGIQITVTEHDGVHAVSVHASCNCALDPECGVRLLIGGLHNLESYMADYRHCEYWCRPFFGHDPGLVPPETQAFLWKETDGTYGVLLPVVSEQYKCVLEGFEEGLSARLFSWYSNLNTCDALAFLTARGENPFLLFEKCVATGLRLLGNNCLPFSERRYPDMFEYLGWDSRDALRIRINEEALVAKARELKDKQIPVRWFLLDDMWGEVHEFYGKEYQNYDEMLLIMRSGSLYSLEADPERFPKGLAGCIASLREMGILTGLWHPCTGYYKGVDPEGELFRKYRDIFFQAPDGEFLPAPQYEKAYRFYDTCYQFYKDCGAVFVKADNQSMIRRYYKELAPVGVCARNIHAALEAAAARHFHNRLINSMGLAGEDLWNRPISPICRCSDDFLPDNRDWFPKHVLQCAYNSLFIGQFMYTDWDMWWTHDDQAMKNSLIHAVSGGPIYISDELGSTRPEILWPLILSDGRILRCDRPAMPSRDCLTESPERSGNIFKLQNICGNTGVLAVLNLSRNGQPVTGTIGPKDIEGLTGDSFAVYEHFSRSLQILSSDETSPLTLEDSDDFRLYLMVPLTGGFAPIGLADKFISPKTIKSIHGRRVELFESGEFVYVQDESLYFVQLTDPLFEERNVL